MSWYTAETPFGQIAFRVNSKGEGLYVQPWQGPLFEYTDPNTGTKGLSVVGNKGEHNIRATMLDVLTINGKAYGHSFRASWWEANGNRPAGVHIAAGLGDFTDSARAKMQDWLTENWAQLLTPLREAYAVHEQALYIARRSGEELAKIEIEHAEHLRELRVATEAVVRLRHAEALAARTADNAEEATR